MAENDAAPEHDAAAQRSTVALLGFFAHELAAFGHHLETAVSQFTETGALPGSAYAEAPPPAKRGRGPQKRERAKRKPSAFNHFVKERIEEQQRKVKLEELQGNGEHGAAPAPRAAAARAVQAWQGVPCCF
jgi:hypothetical protein